MRHNFEREDAEVFPGNPIGETLPAFTTHDVAAGVRLAHRGNVEHRLTLSVTNLTDALYAEFSNVSFFRPEPGRRLAVSYGVAF